MVKKPFYGRKSYPRLQRDAYEGEYADGVYDEDGNQVIRPLTEEEKDWLNRFNDEYCANNHAQPNSIHRQLDDYESKLKKEMYATTYRRNSDLYARLKYGNYLMPLDKCHQTIDEPCEFEAILIARTYGEAIDYVIACLKDELKIAEPHEIDPILREYALIVARLTLKERALTKTRKKGQVK